MRVLTAHRRDLLQDQTRRAARLREVLLGVFPGLEAALDLKREGALLAVTKVATPAAARRLGGARLHQWLKAKGVRKARASPTGSRGRQGTMPRAARRRGQVRARRGARLRDARTRQRLAELDRRLEELLATSPRAEIVRSLPGMGVVFTAEFLAEVGDLGRFASADDL